MAGRIALSVLLVLALSTFFVESSTSSRSLLQTDNNCTVDFQSELNYGILPVSCPTSLQNTTACCSALAQLICNFSAEIIGDADCDAAFSSWVTNQGYDSADLFATCEDGFNITTGDLPCPSLPAPAPVAAPAPSLSPSVVSPSLSLSPSLSPSSSPSSPPASVPASSSGTPTSSPSSAGSPPPPSNTSTTPPTTAQAPSPPQSSSASLTPGSLIPVALFLLGLMRLF